MAEINKGWCKLNPDSGNGNGEVTVTGLSDNTGRTTRSVTATFQATGVATPIVRTINQAGKTEFVDIPTTFVIPKTGGSGIRITGTSNSSALTFSMAASPLKSYFEETYYLAASTITDNGDPIEGDPGSTAEFPLQLVFNSVPANSTTSAITGQITITDNAGHIDICTVTQTAGDPTISVDKVKVTLSWNAYDESDEEAFGITSNTAWTISAAIS